MVDLRATNKKLEDRSERILMEVCEISRDEARALLEASGGIVKTAIVMHFLGQSQADAERALQEAGGVIRRVVRRPPPPVPPA
jgi:N-acetylmuramic acid 6-phosphate etherase